MCLALVAAAGFYWAHIQQSCPEPERGAAALMAAAEEGRLGAFRDACVPAYYAAFAQHFGEERYRRTEASFNAAYQAGEHRWSQPRYRTNEQAQAGLRRLQEKIAASGKEAFARLGVEERMGLIENRSQYDALLAEAERKALSAEDRKKMDALEAFLKRQETKEALTQVWALISVGVRRFVHHRVGASATSLPGRSHADRRRPSPSVRAAAAV